MYTDILYAYADDDVLLGLAFKLMYFRVLWDLGYFSQLFRFARVCSNVDDFNNRNLFLTAKLIRQGYRYHKIRKAFSKFYHRHSELIVKYNIGLKTLLQQDISEPIFYGDLVYKFKRIVGKPNFSDQFKKIVKSYIRVDLGSQPNHGWKLCFPL